MMKFNSPRSAQLVIFALVAVGLVALALGGYLTPVSRILLNPLIAAQTWLSLRFQAIQSYLDAPADVTSLRQRIAELEADNAQLEVQIVELQQQVAEAEVLSTLVDYARTRTESRYIAAAVIMRDPNPFMQYIIINRGSDDGLRSGMPVVTQQGLVGQIASLTAGAARVQLITDPGSSVYVLLQRTDAEAVLEGQVTGEVSLEMIPQSVDVQPGDLIVTSGLGGNYPSNLVVGQVSTVRSRDYDLFQSASVQPAVDFRQLTIVLIIINFQPVDITPLIPAP
jgi:rod shape-determining protein MreC